MLSKELQERWEGMLSVRDEEKQLRALTEIGRAYDLVRNRTSPLKHVWLGAEKTAGRPEAVGLPETLRNLVLEKLRSKDPHIRAEAVLALIHWRDETTLTALKQALDDPDVGVRLAAIQAAVETAPEELMDELVRAAKQDESEIVRAKAVDAIKWFVQKQEPPKTGAVSTGGGPVRVRGYPVRNLAKVLEEIQREDESSYVRFVAGA